MLEKKALEKLRAWKKHCVFILEHVWNTEIPTDWRRDGHMHGISDMVNSWAVCPWL